MSEPGSAGSTPPPLPPATPASESSSTPTPPSTTAATQAPTPSAGASRVPSVTVSTGSVRIVIDPARREDVLFRVRREENHEISAWWMIGAFVGVSAAVIALLNFVPG